jgi:hypothetical protein
MASYGVWWIELVVALVVLLCLGLAAREAAAFISVARIRQRDGGIPAPRTREEYLLLFPKACPRCLARRGKRVTGWYRDQYGAAEFVDTWQCADCAYVAGGKPLCLAVREADTTERPVMSRQRWFISTTEAKRIERPRLDPPEPRAEDRPRADASARSKRQLKREQAGSGEADYLGKGCRKTGVSFF